MMKTLILTEKREFGCDMAATLGDPKLGGDSAILNLEGKSKGFLEGDHYVLSWAAGHLFGQVMPNEINPSYGLYQVLDTPNDYKMTNLVNEISYKPLQESVKERQREILKKLLFRMDIEKIIVATDADGEGEAIGRDMIYRINPKINIPIFRFWNTGSFKSREAVQKALNELKPLDDPMFQGFYNAQMARSLCDYLTGMKITKALTDQYNKPFYTGRVKSIIISLIGNREREIADFKAKGSKLFYSISGSLNKLQFSHFFYEEREDFDENDQLVKKEIKTNDYFNKEKALNVINSIENNNRKGKVEINEQNELISKSRPLPLSGTDFSSEMMGKYKITLTQSNEILEYLRHEGFTTYQATNGRYFPLSDSEDVKVAFQTINHYFASQGLFREQLEKASFSTNVSIFDDKKAAKQNHTPLNVTHKIPDAADLRTWEQHKLPRIKEAYELIAKRIMVAFLEDDKILRQHCVLDFDGHKFELTGQKALIQGWRTFVSQEIKDSTFESDIKPGDTVQLQSLELKEGKTKCPSQYTMKTLIDTLSNVSKVIEDDIQESNDPEHIKILKDTKRLLKNAEGIGTERTRESAIIELKDNLMIESVGKDEKLSLLAAGNELYSVLPKQLKSVILTGTWENGFEQIRRGELDHKQFIANVDQVLMSEMIPYIFENLGKIVQVKQKQKSEKTDFNCPICGSYLSVNEKTFRCCSQECNFFIFKDQTRAIGRAVDLEDLELLFKSTKENPFPNDPNVHNIYFDTENKYFISTLWNKDLKSSQNQQGNDDSKVVETPKSFKSGERFLFKDFRGEPLTLAQATKLFDGKSITLTRKSKEGTPYKLKCTMSPKNNGTLDSEPVKS